MMEKDEIDEKVKELARSGGNPAMRGVMFANMYIKVKAYDSAMSWLDKFLTVKGTHFSLLSFFNIFLIQEEMQMPTPCMEIVNLEKKTTRKLLIATR
jgi:hypothetical protein